MCSSLKCNLRSCKVKELENELISLETEWSLTEVEISQNIAPSRNYLSEKKTTQQQRVKQFAKKNAKLMKPKVIINQNVNFVLPNTKNHKIKW